jgi:hypothetical protein
MNYAYIIITLINFYLWKEYGSYIRDKHHIDKICPKPEIRDPFHICGHSIGIYLSISLSIFMHILFKKLFYYLIYYYIDANVNIIKNKEFKKLKPLDCSSNYINKVSI